MLENTNAITEQRTLPFEEVSVGDELPSSYRAIDFPGDAVTCVGKVTGVRIENGIGLVELEIGLRNPEGIITTPGRALVSIPITKSDG